MHQTPGIQSETSRFATRPLPQRHAHPSQNAYEQQNHAHQNASLPSHQADHDAALRASLSTLLSCAAAARSLPKSRQSLPNRPGAPSRVTPGSLRLVPESVALGTAGIRQPSPPEAKSHVDMNNDVDANPMVTVDRRRNGSSNPSQTLKESTKRKSSTNINATAQRGQMPLRPRSSSKEKERESRSSKRPRRVADNNAAYNDTSASAESLLSSIYSTSTSISTTSASSMEHVITPTLFTWVLSAGVVVLVSALSFSAGFAVGRESGHTELLSTSASGRSGVGSGGAGWGRLAAGAFDSATADPAAAASCGRDAAWGRGFGLKRLRWTGAALGGAASVSV